LRREGGEAPLTPKKRELLVLFLENPGRLVTRAEIVEKVWGEGAGADDGLRSQIAKLRTALGAPGDGVLKMVRREGYRWEADVSVEADAAPISSVAPSDGPKFRLVLEDRDIQLLEGPNIVGRNPDSAVWIDHDSVSRRHAQVVVVGGRARLEDLRSKNGT